MLFKFNVLLPQITCFKDIIGIDNMAVSVNPAHLLASAAVPAFKCPTGTKMHILDLGTLEADESWYVYRCMHIFIFLSSIDDHVIGFYGVPMPAH